MNIKELADLIAALGFFGIVLLVNILFIYFMFEKDMPRKDQSLRRYIEDYFYKDKEQKDE